MLQTTPQEEAITHLSDVILQLTSQSRDIKAILRKCLIVCELLGWESQKTWFHQELAGYDPTSTLPSHRRIAGKRKWQPAATMPDKIRWMSEEMFYVADPKVYEEEEDTLEVWAGIEWFILAASTGYSESLNQTKQVGSPSGRYTITLDRKRIFTAPSIAASIIVIERAIFDFASRAYVQLKYSNSVGDIWAQYRSRVDAGLASLDMAKHLNAIELGIKSDNPESWRSAVYECRNLLNDLAAHLWHDMRPRYEYLPGRSPEGALDVTPEKFGNRLAAYIHQKGLSGTRGRYFRDEAERLATGILSLIAFQSEAHQPVTFQDSASIVVSTYVLVGEIISRTDLAPIESYSAPADQDPGDIQEQSAS
jgi:hypothetical protein